MQRDGRVYGVPDFYDEPFELVGFCASDIVSMVFLSGFPNTEECMCHIGGMYKVVHLLPTGKIGRFSGQHRLDRKIDKILCLISGAISIGNTGPEMVDP